MVTNGKRQRDCHCAAAFSAKSCLPEYWSRAQIYIGRKLSFFLSFFSSSFWYWDMYQIIQFFQKRYCQILQVATAQRHNLRRPELQSHIQSYITFASTEESNSSACPLLHETLLQGRTLAWAANGSFEKRPELWWPSRILISIPMTTLSLIFTGTDCKDQMLRFHKIELDEMTCNLISKIIHMSSRNTQSSLVSNKQMYHECRVTVREWEIVN